ncbi:IS3 family transposase, partial [Saccharopolyspora halophila]|uniref:IS3 family transposase n=1 Tax=Saccharopolyspora halophila TaxID=405551 RepID=UPI003CD05812
FRDSSERCFERLVYGRVVRRRRRRRVRGRADGFDVLQSCRTIEAFTTALDDYVTWFNTSRAHTHREGARCNTGPRPSLPRLTITESNSRGPLQVRVVPGA